MIDRCQEKFQQAYIPGRELSVNEGMIAYRGRIAYLQYILKKSTKFRIKVWLIAESKTGYIPNYIVYTGKLSEENVDLELDGHNQGYRVVMTRVKPYLNLGHHIYFDNLFTTLQLLEDLQTKNTYATETARSNRKGYPPEIKCKKLKVGEYVARQKGGVVVTKWHDIREVSMMTIITDGTATPLTIQRRSKDPSKREVQMPAVIHQYNTYMSGVDLADQLRQYYSAGRQSKKYWKYIFWFLMDVSICNAFVASKGQLADTNKQFFFRLALAKELISGFSSRIAKRPATTSEDSFAKKKSVKVPLGIVLVKPGSLLQHEGVTFGSRKRSCAWCQKKGYRTPKGRIRETVYGCSTCNIHLHRDACFQRYHNKVVFISQDPTSSQQSA
jgi:hypothetical protein